MPDNLVYLASATGIALFAIFWLHLLLKHTERRRTRRIERLSQFDAIDTEAPVKGDGTRKSRKLALQGLEIRFSIVRRTFITLIILIWLVAIITPFVGRVPGTLITLMVTAGAVVAGIAARPLVENFISGFVLTFSKQFHTGNTILVDEAYGTIEDITAT